MTIKTIILLYNVYRIHHFLRKETENYYSHSCGTGSITQLRAFPQGCSDHCDMGWFYITLSMGVMFPNLTAT